MHYAQKTGIRPDDTITGGYVGAMPYIEIGREGRFYFVVPLFPGMENLPAGRLAASRARHVLRFAMTYV